MKKNNILNRRFIGFFAVVMFAMSVPTVKAQYDETNNLFYHTLRTPQSGFYNAAFFPIKTDFFMILPSIDFQFGSPIAMSDVIHLDATKQTTVIDLDNMLNCLTAHNKFRTALNVDVLGFGFRIKSNYFTLTARMRNNVGFGLPVSAINALREGNVDDNGEVRPVVEILNGDVLNINSYMEWSLGYARLIEPLNLTVGVHAKLLSGVLNAQTDNTKLEFVTDPNMDSVTARMYYEVMSAACASYDTIEGSFNFQFGDLFSFGRGNTGLAFDLGAKYEMGPFTFSLAINDLTAGIHWKNNVMSWRPEGGQGVIEFSGMDVSSILNSGTMNTDSLTSYIEERLNSMTPTRVDSGDYWYSIPTKINLGASYSFAKMLRAGLLFHGQFDRGLLCKSNKLALDLDEKVKNTFRWNTTLTIGANLFNWVEVILGSSIVYDGEGMDFFNPGGGVIFSLGTVAQLYLMADYVSSFYLLESKALNFKFGLSIII